MNPLIKFSIMLLLFNYVFAEDEYVYNADLRISYKYHSIPLTWLSAKTICAEEGARLVMPKNTAEALAILDIFKQHHSNGEPNVTYIDSHDYFQNHEFITLENHIQYFYHSWAPNQPDNNMIENCLGMAIDGKLHNLNCNSTFEFICQIQDSSLIESWKKSISRPASFDDPAYEYDPVSGKYFKLHMHQRPWNVARAICHAEGGQLAIIRSKHEENVLVRMFNDPDKLWPVSSSYAHLGFHDLYRFRTFYTINDEKLVDIGYVNWAPGEPNDLGNVGERCGSMKKEGGLNDLRCSTLAQFFCERSSN